MATYVLPAIVGRLMLCSITLVYTSLCHPFSKALLCHAGVTALSVQEDRASTAPSAAADGTGQETDAPKKARSLQKKLKQIQQLKDKRDTDGASTLSPEQIQKLESEQLILLELQQLEQS